MALTPAAPCSWERLGAARRAGAGAWHPPDPHAPRRLLGTPRQPARVPARGARARSVSPGRRRRGLPRLASCPSCALPGLSPSHSGH